MEKPKCGLDNINTNFGDSLLKMISLNNSAMDSVEKLNITRNPFLVDEIISKEDLEIVRLVFGIILLLPVGVLGIAGNIISLVVLRAQKGKAATNYCLIALAFSDLLMLLNSLLFAVINIYVYENPRDGTNFRNRLFPYFGTYTSLVTARITSLITTLLSVERFVAVHFPMQAKRICSKKGTLLAIFFIYLMTIVLFLPFIFKYKIRESTKNNMTNVVIDRNPALSDDFCKAYGLAMNILFRFSPIVIILLLNFKIISVIRKTRKKRETISLQNDCQCQEQRKITIMLLVVTFTFVLGILPGAINSLLQMTWPGYSRLGRSRNFQQCFSYVTYLLECVNSALNFIIYMALSARFYAKYKEIFYSTKNFIRQVSLNSFRNKSSFASRKKIDSQASSGYSDDTAHQGLMASNRHRRNESSKNSLLPKGNMHPETGKEFRGDRNGLMSDVHQHQILGESEGSRYIELKQVGNDISDIVAKSESNYSSSKQQSLVKQDTLETSIHEQ